MPYDAIGHNMPYDLNVFCRHIIRNGHFHTPPFIPGLLPVQDKEKVLKLGKTELLPLNFTGIVLLKKETFWLLAIQRNGFT